MNPPSAPRSLGQQLLVIAGVAVVYYGAARLGLILQFHESNGSPVWPPTGIAFAAVILLGYRVWPGIMIGAFFANLLTLPQTPDGFAASSAICVGNTLESVVGAFLLSYFVRTDSPLARTRDVLIFSSPVEGEELERVTNPPPPPQAEKKPPAPLDVIEALADLKSSDRLRRRGAAGQLAQAEPNEQRDEVAKSLESLLSDSDRMVRRVGAQALGVWGNADSVPSLVKLVNNG